MNNHKAADPKSALSAISLCSHLEDDVRSRIVRGEWQPGAIFPSRRELAHHYGVALGTVEKAIANLLADGTLQVVKGRGTVLAQLPMQTADESSLPTSTSSNNDNEPCIQAETPMLGILVIQKGCLDVEAIHDHPAWVPRMVRAIEKEFLQIGGKTSFSNIDRSGIHSRAVIANAVEQLLRDGVQGLVVAEIFGNEYDTALQEILALNDRLPIPMILVTWTDILNVIPHVFYDNRYLGFQAADHLLRAGYRDLVFLAPYTVQWAEERFAGAQAAVRQAGLPEETIQWYPPKPGVISIDVDPCDLEKETASAFLAEQIAIPGRFSNASLGIIGINDGMAVHFYHAASEAGLVAGRDYGLIGIDDREEAQQLGISSMHAPLEEMGKEAALLAIRALRGEKIPIQVRLQAEVMPRVSTSRAFLPITRG